LLQIQFADKKYFDKSLLICTEYPGQFMTQEAPAHKAGTTKAGATSLIFVSAYVCQGISQHFCLIAQPLNNFLRTALRMDAASVAFYVSLLMVPWVIKPIYGLVSDTWQFALPGRNRLRFLVTAHWVAGLAYLILATVLCCLREPLPESIVFLVIALIALAGVFIAFATVVFVAMTVDVEEQGESPRLYFGQQALAYSVANIGAVAAGGALCARLSASRALSIGLLIAAAVLFMVPLILLRASGRDDRAPSARAQFAGAVPWGKLQKLADSPAFFITLLFLILWNLSPSLGVSLYFFECEKLKFSQEQIGILTACTSTGTLAGAFAFRYWLARFFDGGRSTYALVALGVLSNLSYIFLISPETGMVIEFFRGFATFVATLAIYGLAADVSPPGLTATAMAIQIAIFNLASEGSIALGGFLYARLFGKELLPLIVVSSVTTLLTAFLVPYLARKRL
jgi:predicted MFS family arabinose efflux permease